MIIKFLTLRRRSDLCTGIVLIFRETIAGGFVLQQRLNTAFDSVDDKKFKSLGEGRSLD